jgi:hypothetical protein
MIAINIIKEQYSRMTDNELVIFAINESQKLTLESFHLLKSEFEKRNLDLGIIEAAEIDKALSKLNEQTASEQITAFEFTKAIWQSALDQKEQGKSDEYIYNYLLKKGLNENSAFMIVKSLESKSKELVEDYDTELITGGLLIIAGIAAFLLVSNEVFSKIFLLYGALLILGGVIRLTVSSNKKNKYKKILEIIASENDEPETHS